ncbi:MAG: DUF4912 domain-containing protein [Verrucomicrobiota bacterium]
MAKDKAAIPKRQAISKPKAATPAAARKLKRAVATQATAVSPAGASAKPRPQSKIARKTRHKPAPAVVFTVEADEELAMPATVLPQPRVADRKAARNPVPQKQHQTTAAPLIAVPSFLLEGDEPSHPEVGGPGEKFSLGPTVSLEHLSEAIAPLPEAYGTGKLFLTARDPHWLYAHWDFTREEQFRHNARSEDRHLVLRVHPVAPAAKPVAEYHVHPESKHWFVHVERAGETYTTELGYYQPGRKWQSLAFSTPQRTPPDNISTDSTVKFATIPAELSFETMLGLLKETAGESVATSTPLAHVVDQIRPRAREHFPKTTAAGGDWTSEQEQALAGVLAADQAGVALPSSEEFVAEKSWPEFAFNFETGEAAPLSAPTSYVSSFFGGEESKDFWFNINAELVIYGTTEPNATVTFAGKRVQLRSDGSFRFHFALPDGQFELPVTAVSADGTDGRAAELKFLRGTEVRGDVAAAPADPALKPPPGA